MKGSGEGRKSLISFPIPLLTMDSLPIECCPRKIVIMIIMADFFGEISSAAKTNCDAALLTVLSFPDHRWESRCFFLGY